MSRHRKIQLSRSKAVVIAAAGALSVATAASAAAVTSDQGTQVHGEPEAMTREAVFAPRLTTTGQIAGLIAETATERSSPTERSSAAERSGDTWVQDAYLVRLAAVRGAIAQRKAASKATAIRAARSQAAGNSAAQSPASTMSPASATAASGSPQQIAQAMLGSFGWPSGQFSCLDPLWAHESGWNVFRL